MAKQEMIAAKGSYQIARASGPWLAMCEVEIYQDQDGNQRAVEKFYVQRTGQKEIDWVSHFSAAIAEAEQRNLLLDPQIIKGRLPTTYSIQYAAKVGSCIPKLEVSVEYDEEGRELPHVYHFRVDGPDGSMKVAKSWDDALELARTWDAEINPVLSPDGTMQPSSDSKAGRLNPFQRHR